MTLIETHENDNELSTLIKIWGKVVLEETNVY